jgi:hypothetical protein
MVSWIASFDDTYQALTSVWPVIYTPAAWWATCTGGYAGFATKDPLWHLHPSRLVGHVHRRLRRIRDQGSAVAAYLGSR